MCEMETYPSLDYVRVDQGFGGGGGVICLFVVFGVLHYTVAGNI